MTFYIANEVGHAYWLERGTLYCAPLMADGTFSTDDWTVPEPSDELVGSEPTSLTLTEYNARIERMLKRDKACAHAEFDEHFGRCTDCGASRSDVLAAQFRDELQAVYGKMQKAIGIETGDIAPEQQAELEGAEVELSRLVGAWLESRCEAAA